MCPETRDEFEVAIICALPLEAAAVLGLFDQRYDQYGHSRYGKHEDDKNTYSTGRIGRHNIVLAHMPGMGITSAVRVASHLQLSFKKVRLALIVGVCGAAPLDRPIILGDVIISSSVVEFYFGRQYPDSIERKSGVKDTLEIRGLLSKLEIPLIRKELEETVLQNLASLQEKEHTASYPGVKHDRLFAASYRHVHRGETAPKDCLCVSPFSSSESSCNQAKESECEVLGCSVDAPETPSRRMRFASGVPTPRVHLGTVGSASIVMKSAEHRDAIATKDNIIAFEMEGAGVWDDLPCIIIKGVCDYSDSHKNKKWQGYAAATAASAAKAFLGYWTSGQHNIVSAEGSRKRPLSLSDEDNSEASTRARQQSLSARQNLTTVLDKTHETGSNSLSNMVLAGLDSRKIRLEALNFEQLDARHATIKTAHAATCEWLMSKSEYLDWQDEEKLLEHHGFLWIKGKPGAGKSTLIKFAYTNAKRHARGSTAISYFFNARGERLEKSTDGMYRSLLFQLLNNIPQLQIVLDSNEAASLSTTPSNSWTTETLQSLFRQAIEMLEDQHLVCFVDALDECENTEDQVREMVRFFEALGECAVKNKIRFLVCFSSRHYPHITIGKSVELVLEAQQGHSEDITRYVNSKLKVGRSKRAEQIKSEVHENAQGIFLWVILVVPMLQKAYDHGRVHALSECLRGIPKGLDELFDDILRRDTESMENLKLCLKWILYAARPLSPQELYFAMLSAPGSEPVIAWDCEDITLADINRFILSSSKGLVEPTRSKTPTIQFIHESVRDFLLKGISPVHQADMNFTSAGHIHDFLKQSCQHYFASVVDHYEERYVASLLGENTTLFPFLEYSIRHVFEHAELAASDGTPQKSFLEHFPFEFWILLQNSIERFQVRRYGTGTSLLYILVEQNLSHLVRIEVCRSQSTNVEGGRYDYPIIAAAAVGNKEMLELLLDNGANPNQGGKKYKHVLFAAIDKSNSTAVEVLLKHGAVPEASEPKHLALMLRLAVRKGQHSTMRLILENCRDRAAGMLEWSDLEYLIAEAIEHGDHDLVKLLLRFGVIGPGNRYVFRFLLSKAAGSGREAIVSLLVEAGADVNPSEAYGPAICAASRCGHATIVRMLLEHGADVNKGESLSAASGAGHETIVRMLLEHAAEVDKEESLSAASGAGHETIVRMLLEHGADVNKKDSLSAALRAGHETIVRMLLEHGAVVNKPDPFGNTALCLASSKGYETIVRILLEHGADVNKPGLFDNTALCLASSSGFETIAQTLLEYGADIQMGNPLCRASSGGHTTIVQILLELGADVHQGTPLYTASGPDCPQITRMLLEHGADANQRSTSGGLALHQALIFGDIQTVKLLLDYGADTSIPSSSYENALSALDSCIIQQNRAACEQLLRERGATQPSENYLTWVDGVAYLNYPYSE
ncbi:purine and uridine phosphorylase [Aureobasidium sp. EXF-10728]|nr:purine and uridine phosphorylase [Aureobasidium sp. EXF-10728]